MKIIPIPIDLLVPDPTQPRTPITPAEVDALGASILDSGLLNPIRVRPADGNGRHVITSGHRRWVALHAIGAAAAECIIVEGPRDEATVLAEQLTENLLREDLSPIDEADGYGMYITLRGVSAARAAEELHVPPARISRALPLLDLPRQVRDAVHAGRVGKETGYYLSRLPEGSNRETLFARAVAGALSRDEAVRAVKTTRDRPNTSATLTRVTCKLTAGRSVTVSGSAVNVDGLIEILEGVLKEARKARAQNWDVSTLAKVFRDQAEAGGAA